MLYLSWIYKLFLKHLVILYLNTCYIMYCKSLVVNKLNNRNFKEVIFYFLKKYVICSEKFTLEELIGVDFGKDYSLPFWADFNQDWQKKSITWCFIEFEICSQMIYSLDFTKCEHLSWYDNKPFPVPIRINTLLFLFQKYKVKTFLLVTLVALIMTFHGGLYKSRLKHISWVSHQHLRYGEIVTFFQTKMLIPWIGINKGGWWLDD